ncbi:hypothetical protein [Nocardia cyriacigeorgica]|uniref:hypothetical protein n=1 Tax=Nocardia cyriacigeorgica TaxID=135487 RepID=UPI002454639B|nr:hypothetical protein [Nocardia cyriacigeorgica]
MYFATDTDATNYVREFLGLPATTSTRIEVSRHDHWANSFCEVTGAPAAFEIEYATWDHDERAHVPTSVIVAADIAADQLAAITGDDDTDAYYGITVNVAYYWLRYAAPVAAAA